jgi:transketolase
MDAVQAANSGHPGMPMGAATMAFTLWTRHLRHNPRNPRWFDRDRFILSAGHGSMLLYSLLHLTGYDLPMEEIQRFRQLHSKTPGHPENFMTPGVEMATGPLGQGFATGVGFALAERFLASTFNREGHQVVDHMTYVICSDGDLMEGVSNEAASLAGHLKLGKLVYLYDDNRITIDGSTDLAFTEDVLQKFEAFGWHVQRVDGHHVEAVDNAIQAARVESERPSLIACRTVIGYGSPNKAGSSKSHGSPLGPEEVDLAKGQLGIPREPKFHIDPNAQAEFRSAVEAGQRLEGAWEEAMDRFATDHPDLAAQLRRAISGDWGQDWIDALPVLDEKIATRAASGKVLQAIAPHLPTLVGGSADLAESNLTHLKGFEDQQADSPHGRNISFGVREHAMAAALNGINLHGGCRAYGGTFLIFSDYCRPSIRLAALMEVPTTFVFTHDSIGLGEDGPTHQPVEHLMALRAIPNLNVLRPADANETVACWKIALESKHSPCALALTRQGVPALTPSDVRHHPAARGAYVLREASGDAPRVVIVATGSEVQLAVGARDILEEEGIPTRVVSMPSWMLFEEQEEAYRQSVLPKGVPAVSVEAGVTLGWSRWAHAHVGIDRFGVSAPGDVALEYFGFTRENVAEVARSLVK